MEFSFKLVYIPPCVVKIFKFMVFTFLKNALNIGIFTNVPPHSKLSPKFLSRHPSHKKITHSPRKYFLENLFPPTAKRGGGDHDLLYKNSIRKYEDDLGH